MFRRWDRQWNGHTEIVKCHPTRHWGKYSSKFAVLFCLFFSFRKWYFRMKLKNQQIWAMKLQFFSHDFGSIFQLNFVYVPFIPCTNRFSDWWYWAVSRHFASKKMFHRFSLGVFFCVWWNQHGFRYIFFYFSWFNYISILHYMLRMIRYIMTSQDFIYFYFKLALLQTNWCYQLTAEMIEIRMGQGKVTFSKIVRIGQLLCGMECSV